MQHAVPYTQSASMADADDIFGSYETRALRTLIEKVAFSPRSPEVGCVISRTIRSTRLHTLASFSS